MKRSVLAFLLVSVPLLTVCGEVAIAGDKDVSKLVARLHEASNEARAAAAASLRRALAANPSARTSDHGRDHWTATATEYNRQKPEDEDVPQETTGRLREDVSRESWFSAFPMASGS